MNSNKIFYWAIPIGQNTFDLLLPCLRICNSISEDVHQYYSYMLHFLIRWDIFCNLTIPDIYWCKKILSNFIILTGLSVIKIKVQGLIFLIFDRKKVQVRFLIFDQGIFCLSPKRIGKLGPSTRVAFLRGT